MKGVQRLAESLKTILHALLSPNSILILPGFVSLITFCVLNKQFDLAEFCPAWGVL